MTNQGKGRSAEISALPNGRTPSWLNAPNEKGTITITTLLLRCPHSTAFAAFSAQYHKEPKSVQVSLEENRVLEALVACEPEALVSLEDAALPARFQIIITLKNYRVENHYSALSKSVFRTWNFLPFQDLKFSATSKVLLNLEIFKFSDFQILKICHLSVVETWNFQPFQDLTFSALSKFEIFSPLKTVSILSDVYDRELVATIGWAKQVKTWKSC